MFTEKYAFMDTSDPNELFLSAIQSEARIGCLRGSVGYDRSLHTEWLERKNEMLTLDFVHEMDELLHTLRTNGPLKDITALWDFCSANPQAFMSDKKGLYAFRVDTAAHRYYLRLFPRKRERNFYIFCYRTDRLRDDLPQPDHSYSYGASANAHFKKMENRRNDHHER